MRTIPYVKAEHDELARKMETKLLELPADAGILFVGIEVYSNAEGPEFHIFVGCTRNFDKRTITALVGMTLNELSNGYTYMLEIRRGLPGKAALPLDKA